jgi:hypothetical protein
MMLVGKKPDFNYLDKLNSNPINEATGDKDSLPCPNIIMSEIPRFF